MTQHEEGIEKVTSIKSSNTIVLFLLRKEKHIYQEIDYKSEMSLVLNP
jgi:hypothetical protein